MSSAQEHTGDSTFDKGKGKAPSTEPQDVSMGEEDSSSDEEVDENADAVPEDHEDEEEDNLDEIDQTNIIADGRRTRGRQIDFAKAAEDLPEEDEDEEDDEDFEEPNEHADEDKMEE